MGKHNDDEVLLGVHVTPEFKALAFAIAAHDKCNMSEEIVQLLLKRGKEIGMIRRDGRYSNEANQHAIVGAMLIRKRKRERQIREGVVRI